MERKENSLPELPVEDFVKRATDAEKLWRELQEECVGPCPECGLCRDESAFLAGARWVLTGLVKERV